MTTVQAQIKLNIPVTMKEYLESKADKFGLPIAGYIRHLILKDIEDMDYPIYHASEETEKAYTNAMEEYSAGKAAKINDIDKFFDEL